MGAQWKDIVLDETAKTPISARVYQTVDCSKAPPIVLYLHGGAFADVTMDFGQPVAKAFADAGAIVVAADYYAPSQNIFPQSLECAFAALSYLNNKRKKFGGARSLLFVAGEEAGGNVAAGVALKARDQMPGDLDGQILLSPLLDPSMGTSSFDDADEIGMRQRWTEGWNNYLGFGGGICHPYAAPCYCTRLSGLAPALLLTAEDDPLRDETVGYGSRLAAAGVSVHQHILPAGTGWPLIYGGRCTGQTRWLEEVEARFGNFVQDLNDQSG